MGELGRHLSHGIETKGIAAVSLLSDALFFSGAEQGRPHRRVP